MNKDNKLPVEYKIIDSSKSIECFGSTKLRYFVVRVETIYPCCEQKYDEENLGPFTSKELAEDYLQYIISFEE